MLEEVLDDCLYGGVVDRLLLLRFGCRGLGSRILGCGKGDGMRFYFEV